MKQKESIFVSYSGEWMVNPYPGLLIAIDCLDGSGQSTQIEALATALRGRGLRTVVSKEPTDGPFGAQIRAALKHRLKVDNQTLQIGFTADRSDDLLHDSGTIENLEKGWVEIKDRYFWSTLAYGYAAGLDMNWLTVLQMKFPIPDLTFSLKVRVETCLERMRKSRVGLDLYETREMLIKTEEGYEILRQRFSSRIKVLDGEEAPGVVTAKMMSELEALPKFKRVLQISEGFRQE